MKRARDIALKSLLIDERAIGAAQVGDSIVLAYETYFGMMGRGFRIVDYKLVVRGAPKSYYPHPKGGAACRALKHCFHKCPPAEKMVTGENIDKSLYSSG